MTNIGTDSAQPEPAAKAAQEVLSGNEIQVVADAGHSNGTRFAACERAGITPYVPPRRRYEGPAPRELYTPERFQYDAQSDSYRCPEGKVLMFKTINNPVHMRIYAASPDDCGNCSHKARGTKSARRMLSRHFDEDAFDRMNNRLSDAPGMMRSRRYLAEHPFADLKCWVMGNGRFLLRGLNGVAGDNYLDRSTTTILSG